MPLFNTLLPLGMIQLKNSRLDFRKGISQIDSLLKVSKIQ